MSVEAFFDTGILVYAVSSADEEQAKRKMSEQLINNVEFGVSGQVLAEFYTTVTRDIERPISHADAVSWIADLSELEVVELDSDLVLAGAELSAKYETSYWDGTIIAAAQRAGAKTLYTEDLNHQQVFDDVIAINPYLDL